MITALLFDLDGTLFDSKEANIISYQKAFQENGLILDVEKYENNFGHRFKEMMGTLIPSADDKVLQNVKKTKAFYYKQNLNLIKKNEELIQLISNSQNKYRIGLVTTASLENVRALLKFHNIPTDHFNIIVTGEDVTKSKPHPECYLIAMQKLEVKPKECRIYEDTDLGIKAAKDSGASEVIRVTM